MDKQQSHQLTVLQLLLWRFKHDRKSKLKINSSAEFSINNNSINQITWLNNTTPIPIEDIQAQLPTVEFELSLEDLRQEKMLYLPKQITLHYLM